MGRIVAIGEVMVELGLAGLGTGGDQAALAYAGDTFNTALYLRRLGHEVAYATVLGGDDPFTRGVLTVMEREGLDASLVARAEGRLPGLYAIERDGAGERRFFYWRGEAPVRDFARLADVEALAEAAARADLTYLSAITLAVVGEAGRAALGGVMRKARAVGFDLNYRARLWPDAATARQAIDQAARGAAHVSASDEDLEALGLEDGPQRWAIAGAEVIQRGHDHGVTIHRPDAAPVRISGEPRVRAVDTTGAGDSFNAGYLDLRLAGRDPRAAVEGGRRLAAVVVQHVGAVIPRAAMPG